MFITGTNEDDIAKTKRVLFNGEDVTSRCTIADSTDNYVQLLVLREGKPYTKNGCLVTERLYGTVEVELVE